MIVKNKTEVRKGSLLLAEPFMADEFFKRTAIFLCNHDREGSFGYIINKPLPLGVNEVIAGFPSFDAKVHYGGPMDPNSFNYLHCIETLEESVEVAKGIYWSGNYEQLQEMVQAGKVQEDEILFILGYAGWSPGQIEEEMKEGSWIVHNELSRAMLFGKSKDNLWKEVLTGMGGEFAIMANYPEDPQLN